MSKIVTNPKIMLGKPTIEGTRITVELILRLLSQGLTVKEILDDYPHLKEGDIKACLDYAAKAVAKPKFQAIEHLHEVKRSKVSDR